MKQEGQKREKTRSELDCFISRRKRDRAWSGLRNKLIFVNVI